MAGGGEKNGFLKNFVWAGEPKFLKPWGEKIFFFFFFFFKKFFPFKKNFGWIVWGIFFFSFFFFFFQNPAFPKNFRAFKTPTGWGKGEKLGFFKRNFFPLFFPPFFPRDGGEKKAKLKNPQGGLEKLKKKPGGGGGPSYWAGGPQFLKKKVFLINNLFYSPFFGAPKRGQKFCFFNMVFFLKKKKKGGPQKKKKKKKGGRHGKTPLSLPLIPPPGLGPRGGARGTQKKKGSTQGGH